MRQRTDAIARAFLTAQCRENGLRMTPRRVTVCGALRRSALPAGPLHRTIRARFPHIPLDTVHRTILASARFGLAEIVESCGSPRRYDPNLESHHHAHCVKCGTIADFYSPRLDALKVPAEIRRRFTIIGKKIIFSGICSACRRTQSTGHDK